MNNSTLDDIRLALVTLTVLRYMDWKPYSSFTMKDIVQHMPQDAVEELWKDVAPGRTRSQQIGRVLKKAAKLLKLPMRQGSDGKGHKCFYYARNIIYLEVT